VLPGMQWISHQLPRTWRGYAKLGALFKVPSNPYKSFSDFGGARIMVTIPAACAPRHELTRVPYFCRQQSGRTWRKTQLFPTAETNLPGLTAAARRQHYLSLFLAILFLPTRPQGLNRSSPKAKSGAWASSPATPCCHPANNRLGVPHPLPAPAPRSCRPWGGSRDNGVPCRAEPCPARAGSRGCWLPALSPRCCSGKDLSGSFQTANPKGACTARAVETRGVNLCLAA